MARENRFRFVNYKEELKNKVIISLKSSHYSEYDEELDSFFASSVERWSSSNSSEEFVLFRKRVAPHAASLKLVHLNQSLIVDELLSFLGSAPSAACAPFLDLVGSLCCDLREDFFQYMEAFLPKIFQLINTHYKDGDMLQQCFNCLSHLIYFLHRPLTRDMVNSLRIFSPILTSHVRHIVEFAAECLAFVLRKVHDRLQMITDLMQVFTTNYTLVGTLMTEVLRGSAGKLHTSAYEILPILIDLACGTRETPKANVRKGIAAVLKKKNQPQHSKHCGEHINSRAVSTIVKETLSCLLGSLDPDEIVYIVRLLTSALDRMKTSSSHPEHFDEAVSIVGTLLSNARVESRDHSEDHFGIFFSKAFALSASENLLRIFTKFVRESIQRYNPFTQIRSILLNDRFTVQQRLQFLLDLGDWHLFDRDVLPNIGPFLLRLLQDAYTPSAEVVLPYLARLRLTRMPPFEEPCGLFAHQSEMKFMMHDERGFVNLEYADLSDSYAIRPGWKLKAVPSFQCWLMCGLEQLTGAGNSEQLLSCLENSIDLPLSVLALSFIRPLQLGHLSALLKQLSRDAMRLLMASEENKSMNQFSILLWLLILVETRWDLYMERGEHESTTDPFDDINIQVLLELSCQLCLTNTDCGVLALRTVDIVCCARGLHPATRNLSTPIDSYLPLLLVTLKSPSHQARLHSLRILGVMFGALRSETDETDGEASKFRIAIQSVLSRCLQAERTKLDAQSVREFLIPVLHLHAHRDGVKGQPVSAQIALNYLLGLLHVQLTSTWPAIQDAVASYAELPRERSTSRTNPSKSESDGYDSVSHADPSSSEDWRFVACRTYWSIMEPLIERSAIQAMDVTDNAAPVSSGTMKGLQALCQQLFCQKPDAEQLRVYGNRNGSTDHNRIDWPSYHLSLWRSLRPISAGRKSRFLVPLLLKRIRILLQRGMKKSDEEWLLVALELFSKFTNIKSIYQEAEFRFALLELLTNPRPSVQKMAFRCLLAYKSFALNNYSEPLEKIIDLRTFRDEIRTFKLDTTIQDADHRSHVAPIFLRILYGRLQLSKGVFAPAIFTNLAACSETEFSMFIELLLQPLITHSITTCSAQTGIPLIKLSGAQLGSFIKNLRNRVRNCSVESDSLSWPQLQALSKVLSNVLDYMGHRLDKSSQDFTLENPVSTTTTTTGPTHLEVLFKLGLCLIAMTQTASELLLSRYSEKMEQTHKYPLPHPAQVKKVRAVAVRLLEHIFNSQLRSGDFFISDGRLEAIRDVCLYPPMLNSLLNSSMVSTSHLLLTLSLTWSTFPQLAVNFLPGPGLGTLMSLLVSKKSNATVIERIIQIVYNLLFVDGMQQVGRELLRPHHAALIRYLHDRMRQLSQIKTLQIFRQTKTTNHGLRLRHEFKILGYLATCTSQDHVEDVDADSRLSSSQADWLLNGLLTLLAKCTIKADQNAKRSVVKAQRPVRVNSDASARANELQLATAEAFEADLIHAVSQLATIADNFEQHLTRILNLFTRVNSRVCRGLLCESVEACTRRLPPIPSETIQHLVAVSTSPIRRVQAYANDWPGHNLPEYELCSDILTRLNSWDQSRLEQPDTVRREHAFGLLSELSGLILLEHPPSQCVYIHLGGLCCALHTLAHADLQLRDAALDYCLRLASVIHSAQLNTSTFYRPLIHRCLWSGLLRLLRDPEIIGPKRLHLLRLMRGLVAQFRTEKLFAPLSLLLDAEVSPSSSDFFSNLQSGAVTRQSQAIRRLALFLRNPLTIVAKRELTRVRKLLDISDTDFIIPEQLLCDFFRPILMFYLNPQFNSVTEHESLLLEQKRLLDYCLDALSALARRLSWDSYRKLLDTSLSRLKKGGNLSFGARLMMALIDAFVPPSWSEKITNRDHLLASVVPNITNTETPMNDDSQSIPHCSETDVDMIITEPSVRKDTKHESTATNSAPQKNILSYMLNVVKQLEPFISKSYKSTDSHPGSGKSKTVNIALVVSLVSLLKRLPSGYLVSHLPHLILQVINVLRPSPVSPPKVRADAIKSLTRIVRVLGPGKPLDTLVNVVSQQLGRGYAAQQVRLFTLHKILGEVELSLTGGSMSIQPGQLDNVGRVVTSHYLDELVGSLAEEIDSRRAAGHSLSSVNTRGAQDVTDLQTSATGLGGCNTTDLPEANGLKAPEGLSRLCRLLSQNGIEKLFEDLENAVVSAASGSGLTTNTDEASTSNSNNPSAGCGLRYRSRALARIEVTLARLPTRNALFSLKRYGNVSALSLLSLSIRLITRNLKAVLSVDNANEVTESGPTKDNTTSAVYGWKQPRSGLLEPRWNYLELEAEPVRDRACDTAAQSAVTQAHLLVSCGLHIIVGLLRYRWLQQDNAEHMSQLASFVPFILDCMRSKYVRVLGAALRCLNLLLVVATSKSSITLMPNFTNYLTTAGDRLFNLLSTHPGLLSTKTAATDPYAQQFASNLYRALSSLVRHQCTYPLSTKQLLTLLNAVDIELTRDAAAAPSLALLQAILQRRLRDPSLQKDEKSYLSFAGDMEMQSDGLVVAKPSDRDQLPTSGAGGGARLVDLIQRLQSLAITSSSEHIRAEARCCLVLFLLNYPHKAKFIQTFVAFCLRQLEHKKAVGRSSALSLLTGLTADLPVSRLTTNHLDETILVSVGAAIEREPVRALRVGMLAVIRLLFTRLPPSLAEEHFRDYLLAFVTAPAATRTSARLLGLQLVSAVLDCQPCLSLSKYRPILIKILGTDVLPTAAEQLHQTVLTTPSVRQRSGLTPLFSDQNLCPTEEIARAQAAMEDASWVAELSQNLDDAVDSESDNLSKDDSSVESGSVEHESSDNPMADADEEENVEKEPHREKMHFEQVEEQTRGQCESLVPEDESKRKASQSALDNHYLLVAYTLEYALRMLKRLLDFAADANVSTEQSTEPNQPNEALVVSDSMIPVWGVITGLAGLPTQNREISKSSARRRIYARLLSAADLPSNQSDRLSLCCAGHRAAREWATRCLAPLLRVEVGANSKLLHSDNVEATEAVPDAGHTKSAFFKQLRKKRKLRIALLECLTRDTIFQLEHDAKEPLNDEWADTLVANAVHLGQLLHLASGRRPVLRLLRSINRIALDELNHRPRCYFQRTLALKITTGLLLRLPRPKTNDLLEQLTSTGTPDSGIPNEADTEKPRCLAYVSYLRAASRVLAREFRQRERLAFMAAATITGTVTSDEAEESMARARLGGVKLSKEQSTRARARRRKAQARLRRALMSGTMRAETAQHLVAFTAANRAHAGPDHLVNVIEAAEATLIKDYGENGSNLIQLVCGQASRGAKARQQVRNVNKATREALGVAWNKPVKRKQTDNDEPIKPKRKRTNLDNRQSKDDYE